MNNSSMAHPGSIGAGTGGREASGAGSSEEQTCTGSRQAEGVGKGIGKKLPVEAVRLKLASTQWAAAEMPLEAVRLKVAPSPPAWMSHALGDWHPTTLCRGTSAASRRGLC